MKIIFSWSIIISFFTIFFYWYGYWYLDGYLSYFGTNIDSYNFSFQKILIVGFMNSVDTGMYLLIALVLVSLLSQFNISQIKFIFYVSLKNIIYIINFIVFSIIKSINSVLNYSHKFLCYIYNIENLFFRIIIDNFIPLILTLISPFFLTVIIFLSLPLIILSIFIYCIWKLLKFISIKIEKFNQHWRDNKIRKSLDKEIDSIEDEDGFNIANKLFLQYIIHSMFLLLIPTLLMFILIDTNDIHKNGKIYAQKNIKCSLYIDYDFFKEELHDKYCSNIETFMRISENNEASDKITTWYVTDICFESNCLLVEIPDNEIDYSDAVIKISDIRNVKMFRKN